MIKFPLFRRAFDNAPLLLTLTSLFWAGNIVMARDLHETVPPIALAWTRWTLATLLVLPFAWRHLKADWPVIRRHAAILIFLGAIGGGSYNTLNYIGIDQTTALNALIIGVVTPVLVALVCFVTFGERLSQFQTLGLVAGIAGVLVIVAKGDVATLAAARLNPGDIWVFASQITWAVYTAFYRFRPAIHWLSFAAVTFGVAALVTLPLFAGEAALGRQLQLDWQTVIGIGYVSVFPSVLAYIFFNRGVELAGANRASAYIYFVPVFGAVLSVAFLGESLRLFHVAGFALIMGGVFLAGWRRTKVAEETS